MEKRKIRITHAESNAFEIRLYAGTSYISGRLNENGGINCTWHTQQKTTSNTNFFDLKLKLFCLLFNLFMLFSATSLSFNVSHFLLVSYFIGFCFQIAVWVLCLCIFDYFHFSSCGKSNHSAEHMIVNFINKYQRLPISLEEFKKSSRFRKPCGSLNDLKDQLYFFISPSYVGSCLFAYSFFLGSPHIDLAEKIITGLIIIISVIFYCKKAYLINYFLQLFNTTAQVTEDSLYLAYFLTWLWIKEVYPEYRNEDWMQSSDMLNQISKIEYQDSQETSL